MRNKVLALSEDLDQALVDATGRIPRPNRGDHVIYLIPNIRIGQSAKYKLREVLFSASRARRHSSMFFSQFHSDNRSSAGRVAAEMFK